MGCPRRGRVLEQDAHRLERARGQVGVDGGRVLQREDAGDERLHLDLLARDQVEEALQVAPFGPADVAGGVVDALELVSVVVAPGSVGPGEPDVEFLVVVGVPGQVQLGLADVHDAGAVPGQPGRGLDRPVGRPAGGQEDVVGPATAGDLGERPLDRVDAVADGRGAQRRPGLLGQPAALLDHVEPDDTDPGRDQQADHQLADQAEADDAGRVAQAGPRHAARRASRWRRRWRRRRARAGPLGDRGAQVGRDPVVLGVQRVLVARRRDQLADPELLGPLSYLGDHAAQRVAERRVGVEPVHHLLIGGDRALLSNGVENLAHLIRPCSRLADHRHLGLGQLHHLGAGGDEREQRLDEDAAGTAYRGRRIEDASSPDL